MSKCDTTPLLAYDDALAQLTGGIGAVARSIEVELHDALDAVLAATGSRDAAEGD